MSLSRRRFLKQLAAGAPQVYALPHLRPAAGSRRWRRFGGATAAKYIRMWAPDIQVALVERNREFISCPLSNRVAGGQVELVDLTRGYGTLSSKYSIEVVYDEAVGSIPTDGSLPSPREIVLPYDRLIVSPGVDLLVRRDSRLREPAARERVLHA